ncbi:MAG: PBP1A family penicillin-binding protein [Pseudomonadota bacterium]|nr:PBP1A family penicillin-binding protein [Pseudomonadota bacterium]
MLPPELMDKVRGLHRSVRSGSRPFWQVLRRGPLNLPLRLVATGMNAAMIFCSLALFGYLYTLPSPPETYPLGNTLESPTGRELVLKTADGETFARRGGCYGGPVSINEVPKHFIGALLAMEDRNFYYHPGIDPIGIARAAMVNYKAGRIVQGGSTITQQLAKLAYLSSARTYERKLEEVIIVLRLELALTKEQILERYLSRVYLGEGCYGLRAAARHYFDVPVSNLTIPQSAHLVALLKSPATLSRKPDELRARRQLVLQAMASEGVIADAKSIANMESAKPRRKEERSVGDYYADWIAETVKPPQDGSLAPLPVRTAFNPQVQSIAEAAVEKFMSKDGPRRKATQAALVAMHTDGRVIALVGGVDHAASQFNRATQAMRQPGSSFKSFVYLAALRVGVTPDMYALDAPVRIGDWMPENYDHGYRGPVTLTQAFLASINTVAIQLSEAVGREQVITAAQDLGIESPLASEPSIALGTSEVSLLELTSAYAAFAADAYPVKPWGAISLGEKDAIAGGPPQGAGRWQLGEGALMRQFLQATVQYGTGRGARLAVPSYGKTGTSQNYRDAWFIGFAGNLVVGVWVGNDDNSPMARVTGGNLPTMIWREFMDKARTADKDFTPQLKRVAAYKYETPPYGRRQASTEYLQWVLAAGPEMSGIDQGSGAYFGGGSYNPGSGQYYGAPPYERGLFGGPRYNGARHGARTAPRDDRYDRYGRGLFGGPQPPPLYSGNPFLVGTLPPADATGQPQQQQPQHEPRPRKAIDGWINRSDGG